MIFSALIATAGLDFLLGVIFKEAVQKNNA